MKNFRNIFIIIITLIYATACGTAYQAKPLSFRAPESYPNAQTVSGTVIAGKAYADPAESEQAFGFDIRGAGMLPVQVVFDNQGPRYLEINSSQTFLEDREGNLWPVLPSNIAYERATKYSKTKEIFKEGAYQGFLGAVAGAVIGAAVGIVAGGSVAESTGKGAVIGAAGGATIGGAAGYSSNEARRNIIEDLNQKSLQNRSIKPGDLAYGFIFFPGEAKTAKQLRLQLRERDTGLSHVIFLNF